MVQLPFSEMSNERPACEAEMNRLPTILFLAPLPAITLMYGD
ncbi:hypothetical protein [Schlesneria sp. DSM 10557]